MTGPEHWAHAALDTLQAVILEAPAAAYIECAGANAVETLRRMSRCTLAAGPESLAGYQLAWRAPLDCIKYG